MKNTNNLRVLGSDPFKDITAKARVRQLLQTHQGRDKLFKVVQYFLRIKLWRDSVAYSTSYLPGGHYTAVERNLMTIMNTRRLFRVGRFVGELVRMRVTLIKCSELVYIPARGGQWVGFFIQCQMICDLIARLLMCVKSLCEDVAFLAQKGFLHSNVAEQLFNIAFRCSHPVLLVDLFLNTLRLLQGVIDASHQPDEKEVISATYSFSLLSRYDRVDKLRRGMCESKGDGKSKDDRQNSKIVKARMENNVVLVDSYAKLLWKDFELHWIFVTELKLLLDIFVAFASMKRYEAARGVASVAGLFSGILSVYRVWTYGR
ncbi:Peroxisomal biogenesis factor 11 (PEX11), putative [Trypanosoma equiperdum]|uniref:Uncharacterized protein n=3 Tax=Trypanozoon TaxID=39700 RepID=Q382X5_TRYB2|nr:hypothetical protein, conserved [Trypanosoma brucei gambiense DAL972]XP_829268.1 hypothetical protein, conserved [Trypanosoma brucei brucei TREU927]EAN80156.1 hypothetical protein, conserved [Trypanosoma brucei brucei TREU927]CBH18231.1 hypothetical protein, conserved [Trypanosoma brucei gambiense DAL972]SCU67815.1 Peroxisomal biogenesis factor 11 (PEX11), putative [Trypanosoma equiperdum]|eukprot:XP_011780495.1 hypothetical protein, conserved [Trypanosoma brucei gambiense DAL972]